MTSDNNFILSSFCGNLDRMGQLVCVSCGVSWRGPRGERCSSKRLTHMAECWLGAWQGALVNSFSSLVALGWLSHLTSNMEAQGF